MLKKLGIGYFEPRGIDGKNIANLLDSEVAALKEKMEREGIKVSSIGSPIGKIRLDEDFEAHFERFRRVVEIAKMLDARYIRMFSFTVLQGRTQESGRRKRGKKSSAACAG